MRGRAGSVPEISLFPNGISVSGLKIWPNKHFSPTSFPGSLLFTPQEERPWERGWLQPGYRDENGMNSSNEFWIILHCLLYFPHHKYPIQLQWYSYKSCQSYNRRESYNFVFHRVCFVSRILRHNSSSAFSHLGNRAEISHKNPKWNWSR